MKREGFVIWFTGLPASGKSSVARAIQRRFQREQINTVIIDSDQFRSLLTPEPTYSEAERDWFYQVLAGLAAWLASSGINVLVAATAHRQRYRDVARSRINRFAEVYVRCDLAICERRDPKGIYALARQGKASEVPGVGVPFEAPLRPEAIVDTDGQTPSKAAVAIVEQLNTLFVRLEPDENGP